MDLIRKFFGDRRKTGVKHELCQACMHNNRHRPRRRAAGHKRGLRARAAGEGRQGAGLDDDDSFILRNNSSIILKTYSMMIVLCYYLPQLAPSQASIKAAPPRRERTAG